MSRHKGTWGAAMLMLAGVAGAAPVQASSHREAPFITKNPKTDGTDFYMFRSYEEGREDYVTIIANYQPLQDPFGGPNYFTLDPEALYDINIDNNGDAVEDMTFRFKFKNDLSALAVPAGDATTAVPLVNIGPISVNDASNKNINESYTVSLIRGERRKGKNTSVTNAADGSKTFAKPTDYIGTKTFGADGYPGYAAAHIFETKIPGCDATGKVFVGQRKESFAVNLGTIFDLVNAPPEVVVGGTTEAGRSLVPNSLENKNITSIALEIPISCLKGDSDVVGGWTTASVRQVRIINPRASYELPSFEGGAWTQVSRLGAPLVNEVVIGLPDKDRWNSSQPKDDGQFAAYVTNPALPELLEVLFGSAGVVAPNAFPRADLVAAFLTGVENVNADGATAETLRLNTALPATPKGQQNSLGALDCFVAGVLTLDNEGCDPAGFPNGRRPGDDTVDIALRVSMGYLLPSDVAPSGQLGFTDATIQKDTQFGESFPYLNTPLPGAGG